VKVFKKQLANETIYYQNNDPFVDEATIILDKIENEINTGLYKNNYEVANNSKHIKTLSYLIKNRFGLDCSITNSKVFMGNTAAIFVPVSVNMLDYTLINLMYISNIEQRNYLQKHQEMLTTLEVSKSVISFKYATVNGYYSKLPTVINLDLLTLYKKIGLTSKEIVAVLLHEIGHLFMGLNYHYRTSVNNLIVSTVIDELNKNNVEKAVYILNNNITDPKQKVAYSIKEDSVRYDISSYIFHQTMNINDEYRYMSLSTNNEAMADNFSTRFNLGKELVVSLDKMDDWFLREYGISDKSFTNNIRHNTELNETVDFLSMYSFINVPLYILNHVFVNVAKVATAIFFIYDVHDRSNARFLRIKQALINKIKNKNIDKKIAVDVLNQLEVIDKIMNEYSNDDRLVVEKIFETIFGVGRDIKYYRNMQKDIELFLNNELFVKATKLKHL